MTTNRKATFTINIYRETHSRAKAVAHRRGEALGALCDAILCHYLDAEEKVLGIKRTIPPPPARSSFKSINIPNSVR